MEKGSTVSLEEFIKGLGADFLFRASLSFQAFTQNQEPFFEQTIKGKSVIQNLYTSQTELALIQGQ